MSKFIKLKCLGCLNSFRQPDFHTYHKTLPIPPKTTIAGMLGSALGISPIEVNDEWLEKERFKVGIIAKANGKANDLWQIRKFETKRISAYAQGKVETPYYTAVIVRELLYQMQFNLYFYFENTEDYDLLFEALQNPAWALSFGREDELFKVLALNQIELKETESAFFSNTILPYDINAEGYEMDSTFLANNMSKNLLEKAPKVLKLPVSFAHNGEVRTANQFSYFTFVSNFPVKPNADVRVFFDAEDNLNFQLI